MESALIHADASRSDPERLARILPGTDAPIAPRHWSFGQLASLVGAGHLSAPAPGRARGHQPPIRQTCRRAEQVKTLEIEEGRIELRAVTGPDYVYIRPR